MLFFKLARRIVLQERLILETLNLLGNISLNLSSFLYLVLLIPQLIHNRKGKNLAGLSIWLHFILFTSYAFDLVYGISDDMPLQYRVVSSVGLLWVLTQHIQLLKFHIKQRYYLFVKLGLLFLFAHLVLSYYFFSKFFHGTLTHNTILLLGVVARGCEIIYCVPQIFKNMSAKSSIGVSFHFICLNILLSVLDTIAAWCLNWELPNKLVGPINILIMFVILFQHVKYTSPKLVNSTRLGRDLVSVA